MDYVSREMLGTATPKGVRTCLCMFVMEPNTLELNPYIADRRF